MGFYTIISGCVTGWGAGCGRIFIIIVKDATEDDIKESYVEDSMCPFVTSAMFWIWNIEDHHIVLGSKTCRKSWTLCGIIWSESQIHTRLLLSVNKDKYFWRRVDFTGEHALPREMVRRWCSLTLFIHVDAMCKAPPRGHYLLTGVPGIAFGLAVQVASLLMTENPKRCTNNPDFAAFL